MGASTEPDTYSCELLDFAGLSIAWDPRVLRPRAWTAEQSRWSAELAASAPAGPILELCCGAGQIGLLAAHLSGRSLVQVDRDPVAASYAERNAATAGITAEVRCAALADALADGEMFPVVIADPPWLRSSEVDRFPEDPLGAVDGGDDGFELIEECLRVGLAHLAPGGVLVLQVGDAEQAEQVSQRLRRTMPRHRVAAVRECPPGGTIVMISDESRPAADEPDEDLEWR